MIPDNGNSLPNLEAVLGSLCEGSICTVSDLSRPGVHRHNLSIAVMQAYTEVRGLKFLSSLVHVEGLTSSNPARWTHLEPILVLAPPAGATTLCKRYEHVKFTGNGSVNRTFLLSLGHDDNFTWEELLVQWQAVQPLKFIPLGSKTGVVPSVA